MKDFFNDGYLVSEKFLSKEECYKLFQQMISDWKSVSDYSYVHEENFRIHSPMQMNEFVMSIIKKITFQHLDLLKTFFDGEDAWLAELSSICVFPNAKSQHIHRDQSNPKGKLLTFFVNIFDISDDCGPLVVAPGYHKNEKEEVNYDDVVKLSVPAGSYIIMNSLLPHAGSANTTSSNIRPVFYFSIGSLDLKGSTYSISQNYWEKIKFEF